jgi:hypothetical protein
VWKKTAAVKLCGTRQLRNDKATKKLVWRQNRRRRDGSMMKRRKGTDFDKIPPVGTWVTSFVTTICFREHSAFAQIIIDLG